jgi:zinc protease
MLDRTQAPAFRAIEKFDIQQPVSRQIGKNIPLHSLHVPGQPVLRMEFLIHAGTIRETADERMLSYFTLKMLNEGTQKRSAAALHEFFDGFGAFLELSHGVENVNLTVYCLTKYAPQILPLIKEMLEEPAFPVEELEKLKTINRQNLLVNLEKTGYIASQAFRENLFGESHPYGKSMHTADIEALQVENIRAFYEKNIRQAPIEMVFSGEIGDAAFRAVENIFGSYQTEKREENFIYASPESVKKESVFAEKSGSLQSSIRLGKLLFNRKDPDYLDFLVTNEVLGGYFGSRLMKNIREEKGYTYGIYSSLHAMRRTGYFMIGADVKGEFTQEAIDEIYKEIGKLQTEPVSREELEKVRNYMLGSFAGELNTPFALADRFKTIHFDGLTYDYYHQYHRRISEISAEKIMQMAQKHLQPGTLLEVVAGNQAP